MARKRKHRRSHRKHAVAHNPHRRRHHRRRHHRSNPLRLVSSRNAVEVALGIVAILAGGAVSVAAAQAVENQAPQLSSGLPKIAAELALGVGVSWAALKVLKGRRDLAFAASLGAFTPLALDLVGRYAPQVSGYIPLMSKVSAPVALPAPARGGQTGSVPGPRISDYTIDAELSAMLEKDMEKSSY